MIVLAAALVVDLWSARVAVFGWQTLLLLVSGHMRLCLSIHRIVLRRRWALLLSPLLRIAPDMFTKLLIPELLELVAVDLSCITFTGIDPLALVRAVVSSLLPFFGCSWLLCNRPLSAYVPARHGKHDCACVVEVCLRRSSSANQTWERMRFESSKVT